MLKPMTAACGIGISTWGRVRKEDAGKVQYSGGFVVAVTFLVFVFVFGHLVILVVVRKLSSGVIRLSH